MRLTLQTEDGALILMSYRSVRHARPEVSASPAEARATRFIHIDRALTLLADAKRATLVPMTTAE